MGIHRDFLVALVFLILVPFEVLWASGLDVQLKDIKRSHYFTLGEDGTTSESSCKVITSEVVKKNGPLTHCHPGEEWVECPITSGGKILAFEAKSECEKKRTEAKPKK